VSLLPRSQHLIGICHLSSNDTVSAVHSPYDFPMLYLATSKVADTSQNLKGTKVKNEELSVCTCARLRITSHR
jgi:hypothetical protein